MDNYNQETDPTKAGMNSVCAADTFNKEVDPTEAGCKASAMNDSGIIVPTKVMDPYDNGKPNYKPIPVTEINLESKAKFDAMGAKKDAENKALEAKNATPEEKVHDAQLEKLDEGKASLLDESADDNEKRKHQMQDGTQVASVEDKEEEEEEEDQENEEEDKVEAAKKEPEEKGEIEDKEETPAEEEKEEEAEKKTK